MPEIVRLNNCKICMYADDHNPPHFHVRGPGWDISVDLQTFVVTQGTGPTTDIEEAIDWAARHQLSLFLTWSELNERD